MINVCDQYPFQEIRLEVSKTKIDLLKRGLAYLSLITWPVHADLFYCF